MEAFLTVLEQGGVDWAKMNRTMDGDLGDGWPYAPTSASTVAPHVAAVAP